MNFAEWTVLVVEDTYDDHQLASAVLKYHGINVILAHNGHECLDILNEIEPTMIVTDLSMPDMDGWEMLSQIRGNNATRHIPVMALTAYHSVDVANDALQAGFNAYYPKPISPTNFLDQLVRLLVV